MTKQYGTVLVFKQGVEKDRIFECLQRIEGVLDKVWLPESQALRDCNIRFPYNLYEFDSDKGGPVWYIP